MFLEMGLSSHKIKNFQEGTFWAWKAKKTYSEKILIFWKMELSYPKLKNIYIFFPKQVFIYFRKELASSKLKELLIKLIYTLTKTPWGEI